MSTLKEAFALRQNKDYQKALAIYLPSWQEDSQQFDNYSGWSFAFCLLKTRQYDKALDICRQLYTRYPNAAPIRGVYAQSIYHTQLAIQQLPAISVLKKATQAIIGLTPPDNEYSFAPHAIFKLTKEMMNSNPIDWQEIENWLLNLDPDLLSDISFEFVGNDGKKRSLASPLEEWYSTMIKVKAGLNQAEELLELLSAARKRGLKWHYSNDIWFTRKEAFAYIELGQKEKAIQLLRKIILQKSEWFLLSDLADALGQTDESLQLRAQAALGGTRDLKLKVKLFWQLYLQLKAKNEHPKEQDTLLLLFVKIRHENAWAIPPNVENEISARHLDISTNQSSTQIYQRLLPFFNQISSIDAKVFEGEIAVLHDNGKSGMVFSPTHKKKFLFPIRELPKNNTPTKIGQNVTFELKDTFDQKRNIATQIAIRLQLKK